MNLLNIFKKAIKPKKVLYIGETQNCVWCHKPEQGIGCGVVLKEGNKVGAQFCSKECVAVQTNFQNEKYGWTKMPWREWQSEDGLKLYDEPFEL